MPYKPTGKPRGRPPKDPVLRAQREAALIRRPETPVRKPLARARRWFREAAEKLLPADSVQVLDSRGRPRRAPSSQRRIA